VVERRVEEETRTAKTVVRATRFSVAIIAAVPYSIAVSKLRRPFLSDRYFFIVVRLLRRREKFIAGGADIGLYVCAAIVPV
jgi:hypothetical protein